MPRTAHRTPTRNHPQKRPHAASSSTEDSRLHTVVDDRHHSYYAYDHTGERTLKVTGHSHQLDVNADLMHTAAGLDEFTLYPSPYLVFTSRSYTKHYYAGSERLAARIGGGFDRAILHEQTDLAMTATHLFKQSQHHSNERHLNAPPAHTIHRDHLSENIYMAMMREFEIPMHLVANAVIKSNNLLSTAQNIVSGSAEPDVYFYHSDHLGSANWITDATGTPVQHLQYLPYGEPYINQRVSGYSERFTFTGKERDEETGYSYFSARYLDHEILTSFLSVDRYADKYPSISPYAYCAWNPIRLIDPSGDTCKFASKEDEVYVKQLLDKNCDVYSSDFAEKYNALDKSTHNYYFESWEYSDERAESGLFTPNSAPNTSTIRFTKGETPETRNPIFGASEFRNLFEETFHAWKFEDNGHRNFPSCLSEAMAWQFSALAPGTRTFNFDIKDLTLMGYILYSNPKLLALEFKMGFSNKNYPQSPFYPDLPLWPDNKFRVNIGLPELH